MSLIEIPVDDSVAMVRAIRDKHYEETKHMTYDEKMAYYEKKAEAFQRRMDQVEPDYDRFPFLAKKKAEPAAT